MTAPTHQTTPRPTTRPPYPLGPPPALDKLPSYGSALGNLFVPRSPYNRPDQMPEQIIRGHAVGSPHGYPSLLGAIAAARLEPMGATPTARAIIQVGDRFRVTEAVKDAYFEPTRTSPAHGINPLRINHLRESQLELAWIDTPTALRAIVDGAALVTAVNP